MGAQCGAQTKDGASCRYPADICPWHRGSAAPKQPRGVSTRPPQGRDLRELGWWLIGEVLEGGIEQREAAVVSTLIRMLATLGPAPMEEDRALRQVALRGRLMHGMPPATDEAWRLAEAMFEPAAIMEFRRWVRLLEGDGDDGIEPLVLGEMRGEQPESPLVAHRDNRG